MGQVSEEGPYLVQTVPILDEHSYRDKFGNEVVVDEGRLQRIAAKCNARVKTTGDMAPVVIGHTRNGIDEEQQPDIVGFARDFFVDDLRNGENGEPVGRKAIYAKLKVFKKDRDRVNQHPRRSVEFWENSDDIDPISLLGATTPQRDLGLVFFNRNNKERRLYERNGDHKVRREFDAAPLRFDREEFSVANELEGQTLGNMTVSDLMEAIANSAWGKELTSKVDSLCQGEQMEHEGGGEMPPPGGEGGGEDDLLGPAQHEGGMDEGGMPEGAPPEEDEEEARQGEPDQMNASMGGPMNTHVPGGMSGPYHPPHHGSHDPMLGHPSHHEAAMSHMNYARDPYADEYAAPVPPGYVYDPRYGYIPAPAPRPAPVPARRPAPAAPAKKSTAVAEDPKVVKLQREVTELRQKDFRTQMMRGFEKLTSGPDAIDFGSNEAFNEEVKRVWASYWPKFDTKGMQTEFDRMARHYRRAEQGSEQWAVPPEMLRDVTPVQMQRQAEAFRSDPMQALDPVRLAREQGDMEAFVKFCADRGITDPKEGKRQYAAHKAGSNGTPVPVR